jgi:hypothetical protein
MIIFELNSFEKLLFCVKNVIFAVQTHSSLGFTLFFIGLLGIAYNYKNFFSPSIAVLESAIRLNILPILSRFAHFIECINSTEIKAEMTQNS